MYLSLLKFTLSLYKKMKIQDLRKLNKWGLLWGLSQIRILESTTEKGLEHEDKSIL